MNALVLSAVGAVALTLMLGRPEAAAQAILTENWEEYADGASVASPWSATGGGGTSPAASTVSVTHTTINGTTSNWAYVNNAAGNEGTANPALSATFTPETAPLDISFTYMIPANYSSQLTFYLEDSSGHVATQLVLGTNYQRNGMGYIDSSGVNQSVGHMFSAGETVTVNLTDINLATDTYDISWSSSTGAHSAVAGATFRGGATVTNFSRISFADNSATTTISKLYLDGISVAAVPEPKPLAFAGLAALALGFAGLARCRCAA